ncbi:MAG TPA: hypothetical protein VMC79_06010, partial [Rectinemataceae bacterium]|nr:hypothetical protein [Rectinemataceae bacterium]
MTHPNHRLHRGPVRAPVLTLAAAIACGPGLFAQGGSEISFSATGTVSSFAQLSSTRSIADGLPPSPGFAAQTQALTLLSAESPGFLFRLRLATTADASKASALNAGDLSNALFVDVREAESALLLSNRLALRTGKLLRNFGIGGYGSPANPFARDPDQGGFWGLNFEWTPSPAFSALGIVSADRALQAGSLSDLYGFDSG